jgi:hypothetical protein
MLMLRERAHCYFYRKGSRMIIGKKISTVLAAASLMGILTVTGAQADPCRQVEGKPLAEWDFNSMNSDPVTFNIVCDDDYQETVQNRNETTSYSSVPAQSEPDYEQRAQRD